METILIQNDEDGKGVVAKWRNAAGRQDKKNHFERSFFLPIVVNYYYLYRISFFL